MKNFRKLSVAILLSATLGFNVTSCIDDTVSPEVAQIYQGQASLLAAQSTLLSSEATLNTAQAQLEVAKASEVQAQIALLVVKAALEQTRVDAANQDNAQQAALDAIKLEEEQAALELLIEENKATTIEAAQTAQTAQLALEKEMAAYLLSLVTAKADLAADYLMKYLGATTMARTYEGDLADKNNALSLRKITFEDDFYNASQLEYYNNDLADLNADLEAQNEYLAELEEALADPNSTEAQVSELKEARQALWDENDTLYNEIDELNIEINTLWDKLNTDYGTVNDLFWLRDNLDMYEGYRLNRLDNIAYYEREIVSMTADLDGATEVDLEAALNEKNEKRAEADVLQDEYNTLNDAYWDLYYELQNIDTEYQNAVSNLANYNANTEAYATNLENAQDDLGDAQDDYDAAKAAYDLDVNGDSYTGSTTDETQGITADELPETYAEVTAIAAGIPVFGALIASDTGGADLTPAQLLLVNATYGTLAVGDYFDVEADDQLDSNVNILNAAIAALDSAQNTVNAWTSNVEYNEQKIEEYTVIYEETQVLYETKQAEVTAAEDARDTAGEAKDAAWDAYNIAYDAYNDAHNTDDSLETIAQYEDQIKTWKLNIESYDIEIANLEAQIATAESLLTDEAIAEAGAIRLEIDNLEQDKDDNYNTINANDTQASNYTTLINNLPWMDLEDLENNIMYAENDVKYIENNIMELEAAIAQFEAEGVVNKDYEAEQIAQLEQEIADLEALIEIKLAEAANYLALMEAVLS